MKKFLPFFILIFAFVSILLAQMGVDGNITNASQLKADKKRDSLFENNYKKLKVVTTKGTKINFQKKEDKIVLLNFWASWCTPCIKEMKTLKKFVKKYKDKVVVVGINGDEENPNAEITKIENKLKLNFESVIDPDSNISGKFLVESFPYTIIYKNGKVIYATDEEHDFMDKEFIALIDKEIKL